MYLDQPQIQQVNKYLEEVTSRWKPVQVELLSVQTMLEEVVTYWKRYTACVDLLTVWLTDAEHMLQQSQQERQVSRHHHTYMYHSTLTHTHTQVYFLTEIRDFCLYHSLRQG